LRDNNFDIRLKSHAQSQAVSAFELIAKAIDETEDNQKIDSTQSEVKN